ncbi:MAG: hypothetical protein Q8P68_01125 [Candidatus Peregrinibacteria bacterium]|nr:hypothetical protein [Candidatus Peregrinibacteria bacterium]MDZ4244328.1 hypothetical protein [Candidatus Gracilibacteria bacterium]
MTRRAKFDDFEEGEFECGAFEGPLSKEFIGLMYVGLILATQVRDALSGLGIGSRPISLIPRSELSQPVIALDAATQANKARHDASKARCKLRTKGLSWDSPEAYGAASKNEIERLRKLQAGAIREDTVLGQEATPVLGRDFGYDPVSKQWVGEKI